MLLHRKKKTISKAKRQPTEWVKILANCIPNKELKMSRIYLKKILRSQH